jgi:hypothetical protein
VLRTRWHCTFARGDSVRKELRIVVFEEVDYGLLLVREAVLEHLEILVELLCVFDVRILADLSKPFVRGKSKTGLNSTHYQTCSQGISNAYHSEATGKCSRSYSFHLKLFNEKTTTTDWWPSQLRVVEVREGAGSEEGHGEHL